MYIGTWRYRSCRAAGESPMTSEASRRALLAFCSPSAAMTCNSDRRYYSTSTTNPWFSHIYKYMIFNAIYIPWRAPREQLRPRLPWLVAAGLAVVRLCCDVKEIIFKYTFLLLVQLKSIWYTHISTRSTLMPHESVASSSEIWNDSSFPR